MARYVAFLRAINVGGHTVRMDRLRSLFEEIGFGGVRTFIASGNVVFESRARSTERLEATIATHLEDALGYGVSTFIRTIPALREVLAEQPFPAQEVAAAHALVVAFLAGAPDGRARARIEALRSATDLLRVRGRELFWLRPVRESDPKVPRLLERAAGAPMTARNITTVRSLVEKHGD